MYKTICFITYYGDSGGIVSTFHKYKKWLEETQQKQNIEIISVTGLENILVVTYKILD